MKYSIEEIATSKDYLKKVFRKGIEAHCYITHVSNSGMSRSIKVMAPFKTKDGKLTILDVSMNIATLLDYPFDHNNWGVKMSGYGMDMAYYLISQLSKELGHDIKKCSI